MKTGLVLTVICCLLGESAFADQLSLNDVIEQALKQSKLTMSGSKPFHLKVSINETTDPKSDYQATIEEYWVAPSKWRRIITSPNFSQTLVTNGDSVSETNQGDYFPFWLNNFVIATFDELPARLLDALKNTNAQIQKPNGSAADTTCANLPARVDRWVICFDGRGLFSSVFTKGYFAEFKDYKKFGDKRVARRILDYPEPGTTIEARVIELTELIQPSEHMFEVERPTRPDQCIRSIRISEDTLRNLSLVSTDIVWPTVGEGLTTGGCAVYVSVDRTGQIREVWPEGCDNAGLQDPLREAVKKWHLRGAVVDGAPVQVEALLGFTFHTTLDSSKSLPQLSDSEARKLASNTIEPVFPPGSTQNATEFVVQISVDETGKVTGVSNTHNLSGLIFGAIDGALIKWHFRPYMKDGKPQYFHADLVFHTR